MKPSECIGKTVNLIYHKDLPKTAKVLHLVRNGVYVEFPNGNFCKLPWDCVTSVAFSDDRFGGYWIDTPQNTHKFYDKFYKN